MEAKEIILFLLRWAHVLLGIVWMGMLYYFNFVQAVYFKEATPEGLADAKAKLAPRAFTWFRRGAEITLVTGIILLVGLGHTNLMNEFIVLGATLGIIMFINVVAIIWPKQKIVLGLKEGDAAAAAQKAMRASRTNVMFSGPMSFCMLASSHFGYSQDHLIASGAAGLGLYASLAIVALLQANALFGKLGPLASIRGVIYAAFALSALFYCLILFA